MTCCRHILSCTLLTITLSATGLCGQTGKQAASAKQNPLPTLSAQEIFRRVSPSVMVVESLDAQGKVTKLGSAVVIAPDSIITNRHVIEDGVSFRVEHNGRKWPAKLIKVDPDHDLAELSVADLDAPAVNILDSSKLAVGQKVYAIGSPEGLELTISEGLISGLRDFDSGRVIQTSAAISPGSSGGGLFDAQGRLVGITTFYLKEGQSLNFALPAEWTLALDGQPAKPAPLATKGNDDLGAFIWFEIGYKAGQAGEYPKAISAFRHAIHLKPHFPEAHYDLAHMLLKTHDREGALVEIREVLRESPNDSDALETLALLLLGKKDYEGSAKAYRQLIDLHPDSAGLHMLLGSVLEDEGKLKLALAEYRVALALDPSSRYDREIYDQLLVKLTASPPGGK